MEKSRTLLAILLATVVLIVWDRLFLRPRPQETPPQQVEQVQPTAPVESVAVKKPNHVPPTSLREVDHRDPVSRVPVREELIEVENDLWGATISSRGGNVVSWRLKQFDDRRGENVQLVKGIEGEYGVRVEGENEGIDFSRGIFSHVEDTEEPSGGKRRITFSCTDTSGVTISKSYTFADSTYRFGLELRFSGAKSSSKVHSYRLQWSSGLPVTETDPKQDGRNFATMGLVGSENIKDGIGAFRKEQSKRYEGNVRWAAVRSKYFISGLVVERGSATELVTFGSTRDSTTGFGFVLPVVPGEVTEHSFVGYVGPLDYWQLKDLGVGLEKAVDMGFKFIRPISRLLLRFMVFCYEFAPNYGAVIILMALITKVIFFPLTRVSVRSMRQMQKLQPEMTELRKKYAKDAQRLNKETLALYKKHKVNPASGCLPLLIQMPVFFALYSVLSSSIELRHAHFVWWVTDLSISETAARVGGFPIHVLPLLMTVVTYLQQRLTPTDPKQKTLMALMPVIMLVIFYGLPSGLVLYWTVNSAFTLVEHLLAGKQKEAPAEAPGQAAPATP